MLPDFKFHHIGITVFDIDDTAQYYIDAGYQKTETVIDAIQNVKICFLTKEGMPMLELLAPVDENSPVNRTLDKMGVTPYHCCYSVDDMEGAIARLKKIKFVPLIKAVEACAIGGRRVCFLFNKKVGLIELVES